VLVAIYFFFLKLSECGVEGPCCEEEIGCVETLLTLVILLSRHCGLRGGLYRGADKSLARLTSRCILFDGENVSFDASLVIYINSINIPPIMIINRIYEHQNLLSL